MKIEQDSFFFFSSRQTRQQGHSKSERILPAANVSKLRKEVSRKKEIKGCANFPKNSRGSDSRSDVLRWGLREEVPEECSYFVFSVVCFVCGLGIGRTASIAAGRCACEEETCERNRRRKEGNNGSWLEAAERCRCCCSEGGSVCVHFVYTLERLQ